MTPDPPVHEGHHATFSAAHVAEVEAENLALRDALGLRPGGGAVLPSYATVPARLPGIGPGQARIPFVRRSGRRDNPAE